MHRRRPVVACPPVIYYVEDGVQESFIKHRLLGYGGFAAVYEVERASDGCRMAAKVLPLSSLADANKLRRVQNEIDINQLVHHPHVVTFLGSFQDEQNVYLLQELCCITLGELLKKVGRLSELQTAHILWQVLSALDHLHGCAVVHRDLKLSNMFLGRDGTVKVGDLGLACHLPHPSSRRRSTCGSLNWMAPEVLRPGQAGYGMEVDVWALGVMLFMLLVGWPPFASQPGEEAGGLPPTTYGRILAGAYRLPDAAEVALGPEARDLVGQLLVVNPAARPSLAAVRAHLFLGMHLGPMAAEALKMTAPSLCGPSSRSMSATGTQRHGSSHHSLGQHEQQQHVSGSQGDDGGVALSPPALVLASSVGASHADDGSETMSTLLLPLSPPALGLRSVLCATGLAALAASAAYGGPVGCDGDSTSGSYMELSHSEQCSVATSATTAGAPSEAKWAAAGRQDQLPLFARHSHNSFHHRLGRSKSHCPRHRESEQMLLPAPGAGVSGVAEQSGDKVLRGSSRRLLARGSVPARCCVESSLSSAADAARASALPSSPDGLGSGGGMHGASIAHSHGMEEKLCACTCDPQQRWAEQKSQGGAVGVTASGCCANPGCSGGRAVPTALCITVPTMPGCHYSSSVVSPGAVGLPRGVAGGDGGGDMPGCSAYPTTCNPTALRRSGTSSLTCNSSLRTSSYSVSHRSSAHMQTQPVGHMTVQLPHQQQYNMGQQNRRRARRATVECPPVDRVVLGPAALALGRTSGEGDTRTGAGLRVAFLSHHPAPPSNRRMLASRSGNVRASVLGMRSGMLATNDENDGSSDTIRSYADSLEAMLMGGNGRNIVTQARQGPVPFRAPTVTVAPSPSRGNLGCGTGPVPIVLRHARSSVGALMGRSETALAVPRRLPSSPPPTFSMPLVLDCGSQSVRSAPPDHTAQVESPRHLDLEQELHASGGALDGAPRVLGGIRRPAVPPAQTPQPSSLSLGASTPLTSSPSSATTPCDSGPLSLAFFAINPGSRAAPPRIPNFPASAADPPTLNDPARCGYDEVVMVGGTGGGETWSVELLPALAGTAAAGSAAGRTADSSVMGVVIRGEERRRSSERPESDAAPTGLPRRPSRDQRMSAEREREQGHAGPNVGGSAAVAAPRIEPWYARTPGMVRVGLHGSGSSGGASARGSMERPGPGPGPGGERAGKGGATITSSGPEAAAEGEGPSGGTPASAGLDLGADRNAWTQRRIQQRAKQGVPVRQEERQQHLHLQAQQHSAWQGSPAHYALEDEATLTHLQLLKQQEQQQAQEQQHQQQANIDEASKANKRSVAHTQLSRIMSFAKIRRAAARLLWPRMHQRKPLSHQQLEVSGGRPGDVEQSHDTSRSTASNRDWRAVHQQCEAAAARSTAAVDLRAGGGSKASTRREIAPSHASGGSSEISGNFKSLPAVPAEDAGRRASVERPNGGAHPPASGAQAAGGSGPVHIPYVHVHGAATISNPLAYDGGPSGKLVQGSGSWEPSAQADNRASRPALGTWMAGCCPMLASRGSLHTGPGDSSTLVPAPAAPAASVSVTSSATASTAPTAAAVAVECLGGTMMHDADLDLDAGGCSLQQPQEHQQPQPPRTRACVAAAPPPPRLRTSLEVERVLLQLESRDTEEISALALALSPDEALGGAAVSVGGGAGAVTDGSTTSGGLSMPGATSAGSGVGGWLGSGGVLVVSGMAPLIGPCGRDHEEVSVGVQGEGGRQGGKAAVPAKPDFEPAFAARGSGLSWLALSSSGSGPGAGGDRTTASGSAYEGPAGWSRCGAVGGWDGRDGGPGDAVSTADDAGVRQAASDVGLGDTTAQGAALPIRSSSRPARSAAVGIQLGATAAPPMAPPAGFKSSSSDEGLPPLLVTAPVIAPRPTTSSLSRSPVSPTATQPSQFHPHMHPPCVGEPPTIGVRLPSGAQVSLTAGRRAGDSGAAIANIAAQGPVAAPIDVAPEMDPDALAELASRLRSRSFKDGLAGSRTGSFTYRPSRMMPAAYRSPSHRGLGSMALLPQSPTAAGAAGAGGAATTATAQAHAASSPALAAFQAAGSGGQPARMAPSALTSPPASPLPGANSGGGCRDRSSGALAAANQSSVPPREVLMVKWLDYSSKYGLSYVLSNGAVGVLFRDGSQLLRDRGATHAWLLTGGSCPQAGVSGNGPGPQLPQPQPLPPNAQPLLLLEGVTGPASDPPRSHDVVKKLRLLRSFESMLLCSEDANGMTAAGEGERLPGAMATVAEAAGADGAAPGPQQQAQQQGAASQPAVSPPPVPPAVFVTWWTRTPKALVLCMSSGTLQALFCDGSELVVREGEDSVDYLARDGRRIGCSLRAARLIGSKNSITKRIQYATTLLHAQVGKHV